MIETTLTAIATAVTTLILPKAMEAIGEKFGEKAFEKGGEVIKVTRQVIHGKLQEAGTAKLLERAEAKPSEGNIQVLEAEIVSQMAEDEAFAKRLQELLQQIESQSPSLQNIVKRVRSKNTEINKVTQVNEGRNSVAQSIVEESQIADLKISDINQQIHYDK